jgi:nucleotide-binding universal stress UspA family protein
MPFKHVLVPTDFSETAARALQQATEEAALHRATVTLLHVLPPGTGTDVYYARPAGGSLAPLDPEASARVGGPWPLSPAPVVRSDPAEAALALLHDLVPDGCRGAWQVEVATGVPAETIVRVAREHEVDLIVLGTHGRTGLQHVLLGSVAEKVVRLAACPVMTVRHRP